MPEANARANTEAEAITLQLRALSRSLTPSAGGEIVDVAADFIVRLTQPDPAVVLEKLADDMAEASRYTRNEPDHVRREIDGFQSRLAEGPTPDHVDAPRIGDNLLVGAESIAVQPNVAESYLKSAAYELRRAARRIRRERDGAGLE